MIETEIEVLVDHLQQLNLTGLRKIKLMLGHFVEERSDIEQFYGYVCHREWLSKNMLEFTICYLQTNLLSIIIQSGREKFAGNDRTFGCFLAGKVENGDLDVNTITALFEEWILGNLESALKSLTTEHAL